MAYKAIGFDYGGVLTGESGSMVSKKIAALLNVNPEDYQTIYYQHNRDFNLDKISWRQLWAIVLEKLGKSDKLDELLALLDKTHPGQPNQQVLQLVGDLRRRGFKTGLLSNNTTEAAARMRKQGLDSYFDILDISTETGFVKPEPAAFEHFAKGLEVELNELIFIDDSAKSLSTANEVGYHPILYTDYDNLVKLLAALEISVN